ncbi:MAG: hypothetical protein ACXADO_00815 [Candidatus Thorarchaeota archaeon]|jgi:hypothetical protein
MEETERINLTLGKMIVRLPATDFNIDLTIRFLENYKEYRKEQEALRKPEGGG